MSRRIENPPIVLDVDTAPLAAGLRKAREQLELYRRREVLTNDRLPPLRDRIARYNRNPRPGRHE